MSVSIASPTLAAMNGAVTRAVRLAPHEDSRQLCIALETPLEEDSAKANPSAR